MSRKLLAFFGSALGMATLVGSAFGGQLYNDDYTDGVNTAAFTGSQVGWGFGNQIASYNGVGYLGSTLFTQAQGGYGKTTNIDLNNATVGAGQVLFIKAGLLSDVVSDGNNYAQYVGNGLDLWDGTDRVPGQWYSYNSNFLGGGRTTGDGQITGNNWDDNPLQYYAPTDNYYPYVSARNGLYGDVDVTTVDQTQLGTGRNASWVLKPSATNTTIIDIAGPLDTRHFVSGGTDTWSGTFKGVSPQIFSTPYSGTTKVTMSHAYAVAKGLTDAQVRNIDYSTVDPTVARSGFTSLEVGITKTSDFTLDYVVDGSDYNVALANLGTGGPAGTNTMQQGDATGDGFTDGSDYNAVLANLGTSSDTAAPRAQDANGVHVKYDPATGALTITVPDMGSASGLNSILVTGPAALSKPFTTNGIDAASIDPVAWAAAGGGQWWQGYFNGKEQWIRNSTPRLNNVTDLLLATYAPGLTAAQLSTVEYGAKIGATTSTYFSQVEFVAVPEPASLGLLALGGLLALRRRAA